jgi:heptosyltransferase-1
VSRNDSLLVLRLSAMGDVIHTLPAVLALREKLGPQVLLGWAVEEPYRELVELTAPVDEVFPVATRRWRKNLFSASTRREIAATARAIRRFSRGGSSIDFQGLIKSAALGRLSGAERRVGFDSAAVREKLSLLFTNRRYPVDRSLHVVEWNLQLAAQAFGSRAAPAPMVGWGRFADDPGGVLAATCPPGLIVLNPGAGRPDKRWPIERFVELARTLHASGRKTLVVWGPGEEEMASRIGREAGSRVAPSTSLRQLAFLLGRAALVVAADTGPLHMAAALGTPVIGLFGPTNPARNGPYGQIERCLETFTRDRLMGSIPVRSVLERVEEVCR